MSLPSVTNQQAPAGETSPGFAGLSLSWLRGTAKTVSSWLKMGVDPLTSITKPVATLADTTSNAVSKSVGGIVSGFKWGVAILLILAGFLLFLYIRPFLPKAGK